MYIIGIGLPRTGTTSLAKFLRNLGFLGKNFCIIHDNRENDCPEMVKKNSVVLSTGGGIVLDSSNRELLSSRGTVFYLSTPISVQVERTAKDKDRPLLKNGDPTKILSKLHDERKELYKSVSDHIIQTENKSSQEVATEIIKLVKN